MVCLSTTLAKSVMALNAPNETNVTVYGEEFSLSTNPNSMKKPGVIEQRLSQRTTLEINNIKCFQQKKRIKRFLKHTL